MHKIELTKEEIAECNAIEKKLPVPRYIQGSCRGCGRALPAGYLVIVTKWRSENIGGMHVQKPDEIYCQDCSKELREHGRRHKHASPSPTVAPQPVAVSPVKVLAVKLYRACSSEPHGSRKLAEIAGVEYSDVILKILMKLREAGKVSFADGKWTRS